MGITKKLYEEMFNACEGIVLRDDYGNPIPPELWEEIGSFEEFTVFRKLKQQQNEQEIIQTPNNNKRKSKGNNQGSKKVKSQAKT